MSPHLPSKEIIFGLLSKGGDRAAVRHPVGPNPQGFRLNKQQWDFVSASCIEMCPGSVDGVSIFRLYKVGPEPIVTNGVLIPPQKKIAENKWGTARGPSCRHLMVSHQFLHAKNTLLLCSPF